MVDPLSLLLSNVLGAGAGLGTYALQNLIGGEDRRRALEAITNTPEAQAQTVSDAPYNSPEITGNRSAMLGALQQMQGVASQGGMDANFLNNLYQAQGQMQGENQRQQQAIAQNAQARGITGSGLQLARQIQGQSGDATRGAMQGMQGAADASQRALQAIQSSGTMAHNLNSADMQRANALDSINRYNSAMRDQAWNNNFARGKALASAYGNQAQGNSERLGGAMQAGGQAQGVAYNDLYDPRRAQQWGKDNA